MGARAAHATQRAVHAVISALEHVTVTVDVQTAHVARIRSEKTMHLYSIFFYITCCIMKVIKVLQ